MRCKNKLTSAKSRHLRDKFCKGKLKPGRKTVFRLVKAVERVIFQSGIEVLKGCLPIAAKLYFLSGSFLYELPSRQGFSPRQHLQTDFLIILQTAELNRFTEFQSCPFFPCLLHIPGNILIIRPDRKHIVKHIIAGDNTAAGRNPAFLPSIIISQRICTFTGIGIKQLRRIQRSHSVESKFVCNQIKQRTFS